MLTLCLHISGPQSNGWAPSENESSLAGSGASAVVSWHQAAPHQLKGTSKPASVDSMDLPTLGQESVNHSLSHTDSAVANGQQSGTPALSAAASLASAGDATHVSDAVANPNADLHLGVHGYGMYAEPAAVQAWATDGAASSIPERDLPASSSNAPLYPHHSTRQPGHRPINGYASSVDEGDQPGAKPGGVSPSLHSTDYPGSSCSHRHWGDPISQNPPGLYQATGPGGTSLAPAARQTSAVRDQIPVSHGGLPSYALPTYAKHAPSQQGSMYHQPQGPAYLGWSQSRQPAAGARAGSTSSLQSLDLAHDGWQERRTGQSQHSYGQRWGRGSRPIAQNGGSATQPSSARVSPERSRDSHRLGGPPPQQGSAVAPAAQRPFPAAGSRNIEHPRASVAADPFAEPGLHSSSAVHRQSNAFHARGTAKLPHEAAEVAMPASAAMADHPRSVLMDWQRPAPVQSRDLAAATDIERLLQQLTPVMPAGGQATGGLTLVRLSSICVTQEVFTCSQSSCCAWVETRAVPLLSFHA